MNLNQEKSAASQLSALFQHIIHNMKRMMPLWEELIVKTNKLSVSLRSTIASLSSFLDTLQKIADIATGARGATKDIGSGLTRLGLRHRSIENKLKIYSSGLIESIASPIQEKLEEWKKLLILLDKEHSRDHKKTKQELHKLSAEMIALQNKVRKGKPEAQDPLSEIMYDLKAKSYRFEEFEKSAVQSALVEERTRFCVFISCLKPVMDMEVSVLSELTHIQEAMDSLCLQAGDPNSLPSSSEHVIKDIQNLQTDWFFQSSPLLSKHCSSHSVNSTRSSPIHNASHLKISSDGNSQKSSHKPPFTASLASTSNDSGFVGQDFSSFAISRSESWKPTRQRSWTGLTQFHFGRNAVQKTAHSPTPSSSGRDSGRKDCPDVNAVDDLVFRSSVHASSLPPTPNPYAVPNFLNQVEGNNLLLKNLKSNSKGGQHQMMTSPNDVNALSTGIWTANSFAVFENQSAHNSLMQDLEHGPSASMGADAAEYDAKGSNDNVNVHGLAAAVQRLEWTTTVADSMNNPSCNSKHSSTMDENSEDEELQIISNDGDSVVSNNFSKPPVSRILRRSSMQGARKPPTPLRRMSSVTGSLQANLQSIQGTSACGSDTRLAKLPGQHHHHHHQTPSTTNADVAECVVMAESSKSTATSSGREDRHGNGRRIPRINRATSQPLRKSAPEEEKLQQELRRERRSRLPCRSLSDTHAEIIQTLNEKFLLQPTAEKYVSSQISVGAGNTACKPSVANRSFKSLQVLCQIPEGVRVYRGVATSLASTNKNSPMGIGKKSS